MKKTLSILLSLLMVLSCVTCLFAMPVSAEEAATNSVVETLPVNDYIHDNGEKTITPTTDFTISGVSFPTSIAFGIKGWNEVKEGSYIDPNVLHQFTFDVTVSDDINDGVKLYPVFHSNNSVNIGFPKLVGMRSEAGSTAVDTAYNYVEKVTGGAIEVQTTTADKAAVLAKGKTYTYTYIFSIDSMFVNHIRIFADGLTEGSVKIGPAKVFPYSKTVASNFLMKEK